MVHTASRKIIIKLIKRCQALYEPYLQVLLVLILFVHEPDRETQLTKRLEERRRLSRLRLGLSLCVTSSTLSVILLLQFRDDSPLSAVKVQEYVRQCRP